MYITKTLLQKLTNRKTTLLVTLVMLFFAAIATIGPGLTSRF